MSLTRCFFFHFVPFTFSLGYSYFLYKSQVVKKSLHQLASAITVSSLEMASHVGFGEDMRLMSNLNALRQLEPGRFSRGCTEAPMTTVAGRRPRNRVGVGQIGSLNAREAAQYLGA